MRNMKLNVDFPTVDLINMTNVQGMVILTLSASVPHLKPPTCSTANQQLGDCTSPTKLQESVLYISFVFLVIGYGGVMPCSLPFGMDQFDRASKRDEKGLKSFFNWYYATTTGAVFLSLTVFVYIQESVSWPLGYGIPAGIMILSIIIFFVGTRLYIYVPPSGSIFSSLARVVVASIRKRKLELPCPYDVRQQELQLYSPPSTSSHTLKLPLTSQLKFFNKAAIVTEGDINSDGEPVKKWSLCSVQEVEELKCLIKIIPIWLSGIVSFVIMVQSVNFSFFQAALMDRNLGPHFQIPIASAGAISYVALTVFVLIYDRFLVPMITKITKIEGGITLLRRQAIGIVIFSAAMVVSGIVEHRRRETALSHGGTSGISPMSVFWLAPQLILMGIGEAFNAVGQIEFYNTQFPDYMLTIAASVFYCTQGGATYLSTLMVNVVNSITGKNGKTPWLDDNFNIGKLDYFYYLVAIMGVLNLAYFLVCAHYYRYKAIQIEDDDNDDEDQSAKEVINNKVY
ncbi:protein NRT1/ PTR FAMILY 2.13-like [Ananas comosus]|uniref:Protein NRT1/ PTR FAMILY 2.13-like n=1 Tax=Ananas comosus TaxID=4615 RepID=A0A6P5EXT9_ANACO|nr:protein NRT1/ PTR FAMILY 2.13-like [Ananas comosus]